MTPSDLLSGLAGFRGTVDTEIAQCLVLLLFLVPEALRFDSLLLEGARYLSTGTRFANTIYPARHRGTVTNWAKAITSDPNVLLPHLP